MIDIGTLGGPYAQANAINDAGVVTGTAQTKGGRIGETHAFLYRFQQMGNGAIQPMVDLGTLGGSSSYGMAINANNHVVGYSTVNSVEARVHAFLYVGGKKLTDLGSLAPGVRGADNSVALGINNLDQVVGYAYTAGFGPTPQPTSQVAFVYGMGRMLHPTMINLNTLIGDAAQDFWLSSANGINDKGQIIADAYDQSGTPHAVLLTPTKGGGK